MNCLVCQNNFTLEIEVQTLTMAEILEKSMIKTAQNLQLPIIDTVL